ncbi:hypothetical protein [Clostridium sporogenes]|uniref:hypothetical protein n=1 Tax=Clostridium sporogenes TaxID=1509 RepID=UPI003DA57C5D
MKLEIDIDDRTIAYLSSDAKQALKKQAQTYVKDVINEASLIEEAIRESGANSEITSNHILQAVRKNKKKFVVKKPKYVTAMNIINPFALLFTGWLFDKDGYAGNQIKLAMFIIMLIIATITIIIPTIKAGE